MSEYQLYREIPQSEFERLNQVIPIAIDECFGEDGGFIPLQDQDRKLIMASTSDMEELLQSPHSPAARLHDIISNPSRNRPIHLHCRDVHSYPIRDSEHAIPADYRAMEAVLEAGQDLAIAEKILWKPEPKFSLAPVELKNLFKELAPQANPRLRRPGLLLAGWRLNLSGINFHKDPTNRAYFKQIFNEVIQVVPVSPIKIERID